MAIKQSLFPVLTILMFAISPTSHADDDEKWQQLKIALFGDTPIRTGADDLLFIDVPNRVEDAAFLPITIKSLGAQTPQYYIKALHLIIDNNPDPSAATFHLSPQLGSLNISTRIRMESFSYVRAIAQMNDNTLHMLSRFVIASGGCSAPVSHAQTDNKAPAMGEIKLRSRASASGAIDVQALIRHPNHNGFQLDPATRQLIPPHYINSIAISYHDNVLIKAKTSISLSENPSLRFTFTPDEQNGILHVSATDTQGNTFNNKRQLSSATSSSQ